MGLMTAKARTASPLQQSSSCGYDMIERPAGRLIGLASRHLHPNILLLLLCMHAAHTTSITVIYMSAMYRPMMCTSNKLPTMPLATAIAKPPLRPCYTPATSSQPAVFSSYTTPAAASSTSTANRALACFTFRLAISSYFLKKYITCLSCDALGPKSYC